MLTKCKDVRPKKDVKSFLKNVFMSAAHSEVFQGGAPNFDIFSCVVFSRRIILKHLENKTGIRGVGGHATPKFF